MQDVMEMGVTETGTAAAAPGDFAYLVGRDRAGRWVAMEANGRGGGLFASRDAALWFAQSETGRRPGGVSVCEEPIVWR